MFFTKSSIPIIFISVYDNKTFIFNNGICSVSLSVFIFIILVCEFKIWYKYVDFTCSVELLVFAELKRKLERSPKFIFNKYINSMSLKGILIFKIFFLVLFFKDFTRDADKLLLSSIYDIYFFIKLKY